MLFRNISVLDENYEIKGKMFLGTTGDRISYLSDKEPDNPEIYGEIYEGNGHKVILPAFSSAHNHMPMSLLRGYGENESLMNWLQNKIFPFEAKQREEDIYYSALLSCAEAFRFGLVSVSEMYFFGSAMARAFIESGIKANASVSLAWQGPESYYELPLFQEQMAMTRDFDGAANGRFRTIFNIHAEYSNTERIIRDAAEKAAEMNKSIMVHVSETAGEVEACRERHGGLTPVKYLNNLGVFNVPATAAHCVHVTEEDMDILHEKNVTVATCPKCNLKLTSGIAPAYRMMKKGINVAVSTDGTSSNNNLNMLEEVKFFSLLQKYRENDPAAVTPKEALYAASRAGFRSQGRSDSGLIRKGFKADLLVLDTDRPYMYPTDSLLSSIIFASCGTDVCLTMSDGTVVYRDGIFPTIDIEKVKYHVESSRNRIISELNS